MLASLAPDIDGLFLAVVWNRELFDRFHHTFGHNLFFGLLVGVVTSILAKKRKLLFFLLGSAMVYLHYICDMLTAADWGIPFFWPVAGYQYNIPVLLGVPDSELAKWDFYLKVVVQITLKIALLSATVAIYIKHGRTFIELISANLDKFLTDFAILPFTKKCDWPGCTNRAHYKCEQSDSVRCILHCKINRNLTISCPRAPNS
jgi:membrane-bound metal-dependent hydrolase YbcI (DUF457 family)